MFTRDLRVRDNPVLTGALDGAGAVVPCFVFDDAMGATAHAAPNRAGFLVESLAALDRALRDRGAALVVRRGDWVVEVLRLAHACGARTVHVARDVSGYAQRRLGRLRAEAARAGVAVRTHESLTVVPPGELRAGGGGPYLVFTPYFRRWSARPWRPVLPAPRRVPMPPGVAPGRLPPVPGGRAPGAVPGGEDEGLARLRAWNRAHLADYGGSGHDDLAGDRTSRVSPYLHLGCLSPLEVATRLRDRPGGAPFVRQLCWRDFYAQLLAARPEVARDDVRAGAPRWRDDDAAFAAWCAGRTGYPLVDAGMRQLLAEGWMHNRARMVVASFLTKDLMIDWRRGAAHFMAHLLDGDVASNQLNWQWVAGTGTDTNPHRVYNPTVQARRFDPGGAYVRRYVDELAGVAGDVHDPPPAVRAATGYPDPIVDHHEAIERWRAARRR